MNEFNIEFQDGTISPEQIARVVGDYFREHPIDTLTEQEVQQIVADYMSAHPSEGVSEETVAEIVADYMNAHPISTLSESDVEDIVEDYFNEHTTPHHTTEQINAIIASYMSAHPVSTLTESEVNELISAYMIAHPSESISQAQVEAIVDEYVQSFDIHGEKGDTGTTPNITINASVSQTTGTPSVQVTKSGTLEAPVFNLEFSGLKGDTGASGGSGANVISDTNFIYVAHRGLWTSEIAQNTADAFINACNDGFKWGEIDIRATKDNIAVCAHDTRYQMYNSNGAKVGVTIAEKTFTELQEFTIDQQRNYPIESLESVLFKLRQYDMNFIFDIKSSSLYEDCFRIAASCGMSQHSIITVDKDWALSHMDIIRKYKKIALRIYPDDYEKTKQIIDEAEQDVYLDGNLGTELWLKKYFPYAISLGRPIIPATFDGNKANERKYVISAINGGMSSDNANLESMKSRARFNFAVSDITFDHETVSMSGDDIVLVNAQDVDSNGGYICFYSDNPTIAECEVQNFGVNANVKIIPTQNTGKCNLYAKNSSITRKIPIQYAKNGFFATCNVSGNLELVKVTNNTRASLIYFDENTLCPFILSSGIKFYTLNPYSFNEKGLAIPKIPDNVDTFTLNFGNVDGKAWVRFLDENKNVVYNSNSWLNEYQLDIPSDAKYFCLSVSYSDDRPLTLSDETGRANYDALIEAVTYEFHHQPEVS